MAFKIALTNVPFDLDYEETIRFASRDKQYSYFGIPTIFNNLPSVNFHINDGLSAECYILDNDNLMDTLNKNYAIIQDIHNNTTSYLFYFIRRTIHDSSRKQYRLELYLDVINTYYLDCTFDDCLIERAHLSRLKKYLTAYSFDYTKDSKLFKNENLNIALNIYNKKYETLVMTALSNTINNWFYVNVDYYIYYFIRTNNFTAQFYKGIEDRTISFANIDFPSEYKGLGQPYIVLAVPHYKTDKYAYINVANDSGNNALRKWQYLSIEELIRNKNLTDDVISIKYSKVNPLSYFEGNLSIVIDEDGNLKIDSPNNSETANNPLTVRPTHSMFFAYERLNAVNLGAILYNPHYGLKELTLAYIKNNSIQHLYDTSLQLYSKAEIRNTYVEPKENIICNRIRIDNGITKYDIDRSIYNYSFIKFFYYEAITPDITRIYIECRPNTLPLDENDSKIYNNEKLFVGFNCSIDLSIPYQKEQYDTFIANNKNFYMQRDLKTQLMLTKTVGNMVGKFPDMAGVIGAGGSGLLDTVYYAINSDYAIDNIINAPPDIYNLNGNPFLISGYNALNIYICEVSALNADIKTMSEYFKLYGYSYGEIDNIKNIDNIRYYYNFVKAPIRCVHLPNNYMSNIVRQKIKDIFKKGIIFYNYKAIEEKQVQPFDYTVNNYENEVAENE